MANGAEVKQVKDVDLHYLGVRELLHCILKFSLLA